MENKSPYEMFKDFRMALNIDPVCRVYFNTLIYEGHIFDIEHALEDYSTVLEYGKKYGAKNLNDILRMLHNAWVLEEKNLDKILEVMKNKPVHTSWFTFYETYEQYLEDLDNIDSYVDKNNMLTKEEFYLLKEYFNGK